MTRLYKNNYVGSGLFPDIIKCITSAAKPKGLLMAKSHYSFKKRQKELIRLKKKQDKRQRKLEKKTVETDDMGNQVNEEPGEDETETGS